MIALEYFKTFTIGIAISAFLLGCVDQIELESIRATRLLVVDGRINNSGGPQLLYVGITTGLTPPQHKIVQPVEADITIFDNLGNQEDYFKIETGVYLLPGNIVKGIPGVEYFIEITTLTNGEKFRSVPEIMPEKIETTDSVILEFGKKDFISDAGNLTSRDVINVLLNSQIPETASPVFLRWHVEENYKLKPTDFPDPFGNVPPPCYITEFPGLRRIPLYNGIKLATGILNNFHLYSRELDFSFQNRHYFNVVRSSISADAMDYWEKLDKTTRVGSIFDVPPSPVQGNIYNIEDSGVIVLGFFEAITTDTTRNFTLPSDLPIFIKSCQFVSSFRNRYPDRCLDCRILPNSSLVRPSYWP